jgi:vancomycin permeability regulator SanA
MGKTHFGNRGNMWKWFAQHWQASLGLFTIGAILTLIALHSYIGNNTRSRRYTHPEQVPAQQVAIVFGAGIFDDGTPTPMLADRVQAAVDLYKLGTVHKLLMTGDNSRKDYDEVTAMQNYAIDRGVPISDITLDRAGLSTYESCYRAQEIFGIHQAVLITQNFHLPRAIYTCERLGVKAIGLGTPDWGRYRDDTVTRYTLREMLSVLKAVWEVHITRPLPTFSGPFEGIK